MSAKLGALTLRIPEPVRIAYAHGVTPRELVVLALLVLERPRNVTDPMLE